MITDTISIPIASVRVYAESPINISGAGATFPFPILDTWRVEYQKIKPNVSISYQSINMAKRCSNKIIATNQFKNPPGSFNGI